MRLDLPFPCAPPAKAFLSCLPALFGHCKCFLCGHESGIPLPLDPDQSNWIECEYCGLDNEIPGAPAKALIVGSVPSRFF